jgi:hypothetical protein
LGIEKKLKEKESTQRIMVQDDSLRLLTKEKSRERAKKTKRKDNKLQNGSAEHPLKHNEHNELNRNSQE